MPRNFQSWITAFLEYSEGIESPPIFRRWAAVGTISAALQRRVYIKTRTGSVYPTEYILLVATPGVGKTNAITLSENFLTKLGGELNILPTSVTKEQLYNEIQSKMITRTFGGEPDIMCAAVALPDELGVFIRHRDFDFMQDLTKLYDCRKLFTYKIKHGQGNRLENVALTILGGTQPDTLRKILPVEAFGMGFAARLVLVYSEERVQKPVFTGVELDKSHEQFLDKDLKSIFGLNGKMIFSIEAEKFIESWHHDGMPPVPVDRRLISYTQRRLIHFLKLCMIFCAAAQDELLISLEHVQSARDLMIETEEYMHKSFAAMGEGSAISQVENIYAFLAAEALRSPGGVQEWKIRDMLLREMPIYAIKSAMVEMQNAGWIKIGPGEEGKRLILPGRVSQDSVSVPVSQDPLKSS